MVENGDVVAGSFFGLLWVNLDDSVVTRLFLFDSETTRSESTKSR